MLEIRLLGEISIFRDGEALDLPKSRKTLALLAYLLVTGHHHRRDRLCDLLWELPDDPRGALRWSLSKLRSLVDEPDVKRIVSDHNGVMFERHGAKVDALSLREAGDSHIEAMSVDQLVTLAMSLNGSFLEDLELAECHEFQAWRTAERNELVAIEGRILQALVGKLTPNSARAKEFVRRLDIFRVRFPDVDLDVEGARFDPLLSLNVRDDDGAIPLPDKPSIAVLPFENLSDDPDQDRFVDGITEDIITALSRFSLFFVIARNSTFAYKGQPTDIKRIARELGVQYVLEGSARRSGGQLRVTAQLIDAISGHHVWAERYDREMTDTFAVQDDLTEKIATSIGPEVMRAEMNRAHGKRARDPNAREFYLQGMWHYARFSEVDNEEARQIAEEGINAHPDDAELYTLLALTNQINFMYGWHGSRLESLHRAGEAARQALGLDADNPLIQRCQSVVHLYEKEHGLAIEDARRTIELNPNDADGHAQLGAGLGYSGDYSGALENIRNAVRLSPRDPFLATWYNNLAHAATIVMDDEIALEWANRMRRARPDFPGGYRVSAVSLIHLGRAEDAKSEIQQFLRLAPSTRIEDIRLTVPIKSEAAMERYLTALRSAGLPN